MSNEEIEKKLTRLAKLERYLVKWKDQLQIEGVNSKMMVVNDIEYLIEEKEKEQA